MKVIAEVGSNWYTLEDCLDSCELAKDAGADAVKFQMFTEKELYGTNTDQWEVGKTPCLPSVWIHQIAGNCESLGIEFMCTAFSKEGYEFINPFVKTHKIASAEITDEDILKTVAGFGKPVYLSTGGATFVQTTKALLPLSRCEKTVMYCVPEYPATTFEPAFYRGMAAILDWDWGYSDHTTLDWLPLKSQWSVIEKHVNFTTHTDTNDAGHSLNFEQFKRYVAHAKSPVEQKPFKAQRVWNAELGGFYRPRN